MAETCWYNGIGGEGIAKFVVLAAEPIGSNMLFEPPHTLLHEIITLLAYHMNGRSGDSQPHSGNR
jgi:hypothetical protein